MDRFPAPQPAGRPPPLLVVSAGGASEIIGRALVGVGVAAGLVTGAVMLLRPGRPAQVTADPPIDMAGTTSREDMRLGPRGQATDADYNRRKREKEQRAKLENPANVRTVAAIRADVAALQDSIGKERTGPEPVTLARGAPDDPDALLDDVLAKCRVVQSCLDDEKASEQELTEAQATLRQADADLAAAKGRFESLLAADRVEIAEKNQREVEKKTSRDQANAFKALDALATHAVLPPPVNKGAIDTPGGPQGRAPIDLGAFPVAHLIGLTLALAVPRDEYDGKPFVACVSRPDENKPEWSIEFLPHDGEGDQDGSTRPRPLANLYVLNERLYVALTDEPNEGRPLALLRRCVLLVSAKRPSEVRAKNGQSSQPPTGDKPHEIRFVKPTTVGPLPVDPFGGSKTLEIRPPPGITSNVGGKTFKLPIASCEVKATFAGHEVQHLQPLAPSKEAPSAVIEDHVMLATLGPKARLELDIAFYLQDAMLRVTPQIKGDGVQPPSLEVLKEKFLDEPKKKRDRMTQAWRDEIKKSPGMKPGFIPSKMKSGSLMHWFATPLAVPQKMGVAMPGHESIQSSLDVFLKDEYREAEERLKKRRAAGERNIPDNPAEPRDFRHWLQRDILGEKPSDAGDQRPASARAWKENFQDTVSQWWTWFEPQLDAESDKVRNDVQMVVENTAAADCRITEITSIAYDEAGNEYRVPLVACGTGPDPDVPVFADPANPSRE